MTDLKKLREIANLCIEKGRTPPCEWHKHPDPRFGNAYGWFDQEVNPATVLALIDKVEATESLNSSLYSEIRRLRSQLAEYENDDDLEVNHE